MDGVKVEAIDRAAPQMLDAEYDTVISAPAALRAAPWRETAGALTYAVCCPTLRGAVMPAMRP